MTIKFLNRHLLFKRIFISFIASVFFFAVFFTKQRETDAFWGLAIPAGIEIGAGVYALGALAVGSLATGMGIEYGSQIKQSAANVWSGGTDLAKQSLFSGMQLAKDGGKLLVTGATDFWDWVKGNSNKIAGSLSTAVGTGEVNKTLTPSESTLTNGTTGEVLTINTRYKQWMYSTIAIPAEYSPSAYIIVSIGFVNGAPYQYSYEAQDGSIVETPDVQVRVIGDIPKVYVGGEENVIDYSKLGMTGEDFFNKLRNVTTIESMVDFLQSIGLSVGIADSNFEKLYSDIKTKVDSTIPSYEAGLVIDSDMIKASTKTGEALNYNDDTKTWTDTAGNTYTGDVVWDAPIPYVDTGTGTIVTDTSTGTKVDVKTGEVVGDVDPGGGGGTSDPPNWTNKFKGLVTTKFPFSLPWDLYGVLAFLNADPVTPEIHVDKNFMGMPFKFDINFNFLDPYMGFFRTFLIISFAISLIYGTRKLLGGAQ